MSVQMKYATVINLLVLLPMYEYYNQVVIINLDKDNVTTKPWAYRSSGHFHSLDSVYNVE